MKNGLNPVIYSPQGGHAQSIMKYLVAIKFEDEDKKSELNKKAYELLSLIKPIYGRVRVSGEFIEKQFYLENEWRYVPPVISAILYDDSYDEDANRANKDVEKYKLEISPTDIRYIFVNSDDDIPGLVDFIQAELAQFPLSDLKILQSRIVSLETLRKDL